VDRFDSNELKKLLENKEPIHFPEPIPELKGMRTADGNWAVDPNGKTLSYVGPPGQVHTMAEFYSAIQEMMDEPTMMPFQTPMLPVTPTQYTLKKGSRDS